MNHVRFLYDPTMPVLTTSDMRLTRLLQEHPMRCATLSEYSMATGIDVGTILDLFAPAIDAGELDVEPVGGEIFVHTAPRGRPTPRDARQVPPNLWEALREEYKRDDAFALWQLVRDLEAAGWVVEARARSLPVIGGRVPLLGLRFGQGVVPLLAFPEADELAVPGGPLSTYEHSGVGLAAVSCRERELDLMATAVRRWMLEHQARARCDVLILEAPRYQPVLFTSDDGGVSPRSVAIPAPPPEPSILH